MAYNYSGGRFQAFDSSGDPLASGKVYTYYAGTTTPLASYTTQAATTPNANRVDLARTLRIPHHPQDKRGRDRMG